MTEIHLRGRHILAIAIPLLLLAWWIVNSTCSEIGL